MIAELFRCLRHGCGRQLAWSGAVLVATATLHHVHAQTDRPQADASVAQRLYAQLRPAVLTIRTVSAASGRTSSYGSGFHIDGRGRAITNYHVVADHLHQPGALRLRAVDARGRETAVQVLAFDVVNDFALLKVDQAAAAYIAVPARPPVPIVGARLYSLGNPLDLGVTVMTGHYSSRKTAMGITRMHFSGTLNAGMSGGPVVDATGRLVGVNVSKPARGEQVGFLVPADAIGALLARPPRPLPFTQREEVSADTAKQVGEWERALKDRAFAAPWSTQAMGSYTAPDILPGDLDCWARDSADESPPPPVRMQVVDCRGFQEVRVGNDGVTGRVSYRRAHLRAGSANRFQFARALDAVALRGVAAAADTVMGPQRCTDRQVRSGAAPALRVLWCAAPYRELPGIYDVAIVLTTQDRPLEALALRLQLEGVRWNTGVAFAGRLVESVR